MLIFWGLKKEMGYTPGDIQLGVTENVVYPKMAVFIGEKI